MACSVEVDIEHLNTYTHCDIALKQYGVHVVRLWSVDDTRQTTQVNVLFFIIMCKEKL